jgi:predicted nucleic acid-binding protein
LTVYADSSFFVSIYLEDVHSPAAAKLAVSWARVWFTPLHYAECSHAFAQPVFHKNISGIIAHRAHLDLDQDRASGLWIEVETPEDAFYVCADLARRYGPRLGLRTLDSLHVACALQLKAEQFWTFDERQAKLAKAVGLKLR